MRVQKRVRVQKDGGGSRSALRAERISRGGAREMNCSLLHFRSEVDPTGSLLYTPRPPLLRDTEWRVPTTLCTHARAGCHPLMLCLDALL